MERCLLRSSGVEDLAEPVRVPITHPDLVRLPWCLRIERAAVERTWPGKASA
jgi:hypothetical protein